MSFSKYPKNYNAHGYGWHNMAAMGYSKVDPSISSASSGVSSLYPSANPPANLGFQLSYGFSPDVMPNQVPNSNHGSGGGHQPPSFGGGAGLYPQLGWNIGDNISLSSDPVAETEVSERDETPCLAVLVPPEDMPVYHHGLLRGAGQSLLNEAVNAAGQYIGNAIQEMLVVKKQAEVPRVLPNISKMRILGEVGSGYRSQGEVQDFNTIRNQCLQNGELFEDPDFPASNSSLMYSRRPDRHIEWLRPMEIADDPQFFVEGYSRFDVQQGELGDCWLLAATASLTADPKLFFQVVPTDQSFDDTYAGIFHFRFWQYGKWIDVVIDDRLPTSRGELMYMHSAEKNEFWSALLEKAYAKLHGSYEALKGGTTCEAMEDFTGGVTEMYELNEAPPNLFNILLKGYDRSSMMGCSIEPDPSVLEAEMPEGLIKGHAYTITKIQLMDIVTPNTSGKIPMIRLRNPWGNEAEWNGAWSDKSPEWRFIPEHVKMDIGLTFDVDGEFWMSFQDWMKHFDRVEICNLSPDSLSEDLVNSGKKRWEMSVFEGEWTSGLTAGGCRNYLDTFWRNPQYVVELQDPDEDDDEGLCTVIVALMQKNRRSQRNVGIDCLTIGFAIYRLSERDLQQKPLKMNFFKYNASVARSPAFINLREVSCRFKLPPGHYLIVPSTFEPNEEAEFLIRVFSENKSHMEENDEEVGMGTVDDRIADVLPQPAQPTPQKTALEKLFIDIAGDDMEIDWKELKRILDHSLREDFDTQASANGYQYQTNAAQPNQFNNTGDEGGGGGGGLCDALLSAFCAAFCKDNPLAEQFGFNQPANPNPPANPNQPNEQNQFINTPPAPAVSSQIITAGHGFSESVCRSMVAMLDRDQSGKLGFEEFKTLLDEIAKWKAVFKLYDRDNSLSLNASELRDALNSAGYRLNNKVLNALVHRYAGADGTIAFDDFIMCAIKIRTMIELFKQYDLEGKNSGSVSMDDWIARTI